MDPVLTRNIRPDGAPPPTLAEYEATGGYRAARAFIGRRDPAELLEQVKAAGLRGRGGAGFPTGLKWSLLPQPDPAESPRLPRYIACNFDEMEPGAFKDRVLGEGDPHGLIEGILLAAWACQCDAGYVFLRGEYGRARRRLERALAEAYAAGHLGRNVLGTGFSFELHLHVSAGRYMCGEETGLLNALEGRRANPRAKPPYPVVVGAWGRPTVINNVETLCCVPHIAERGAQWFAGLARGEDGGSRVYGLSGGVARPGWVGLPLGTTLGELLEVHGRGMQPGYRFRAALPGGASTRFLGPQDLDLPLDYSALRARGKLFGTGTAVVLDDRSCVVGMVRNLMRFFARESCGWCTPCREGLPWLERILAGIEEGRGEPGDVDLLLEQARLIGPNTYCALALGAVQPLESSIELFRDEYEIHIKRGACPYRTRTA